MRDCLINQPSGLGDIIFCQKIAHLFIENGYTVWWPVIDEYYDVVTKYMPKEGIRYCRQADDFPLKEYFFSRVLKPMRIADTYNIYLPLQSADIAYAEESIMKAKYKLVHMPCDDWKEYFSFVRDRRKENELYENILNLRAGEKYGIINCWYGSPPESKRKEIKVKEDIPMIEMSMVSGYTIFDWSKVMENASVVYSVDTVINYIMELLSMSAKKYELYSRHEPPNWKHIDGLFDINWNYNK